jgi:hypothetical protein
MKMACRYFLGDKELSREELTAHLKSIPHEQALKIAPEIAKGSYDRISWTPGEAQAARYDLSKQVDTIQATKNKDGTFDVRYRPLNDAGFHEMGTGITEQKLAESVGKELAEKIIKQEKETQSYKGLDLKVGGEGMKGFYDKMIPNAIEKIGKEHGVKVKTAEIPVDSTSHRSLTHFMAWVEKNKPNANYSRPELGRIWSAGEKEPLVKEFINSKVPQPVHYIDIPQSLKDMAMKKGFPLFSGGFMFSPVSNPYDQNNK